MILHNSYYQFTVPGSPPIVLEVQDMRMEIQSNSTNNNCLPSGGAFAANAINGAILELQQIMNTSNPEDISVDFKKGMKSRFLVLVNRKFSSQFQNCNPTYTAHVALSGASNNWDNVPVVNCDNEIVNCN
jgi:hypothetical protein